MNNILSLEDYLFENESPIFFTNEQINESLEYISSEDPALMEAWYNTVLDFAALIPGVGSVAEGINLVSYAKQGQYLLAGLCAIGLIPIFGQYIGAGGTLLVKALGKGKTLGATILKPLINLVAKFFPKIVGFLKSSKFLTELTKSVRGITQEAKFAKKSYDWMFAPKDQPRISTTPTTAGYAGNTSVSPEYQIPVPKDAYMAYQGTPLKNIRPYTDSEISQAEMAQDWERYL